jgi:hypothetical protein
LPKKIRRYIKNNDFEKINVHFSLI